MKASSVAQKIESKLQMSVASTTLKINIPAHFNGNPNLQHKWKSKPPMKMNPQSPDHFSGNNKRGLRLCVAQSNVPRSPPRTIVGCGGATIDYLATVASFPKLDDKIRSTSLEVQGGGNVGNALTAAARLGLKPRIVSKVADDALGLQIVSELQSEGVETSHMLIAKGGISPFTYIIVDQETSTRTCIHTPGSPALHASEVSEEAIESVLDEAHLVYFDGRLTEAALNIAHKASKKGIPILVDAERPREGLDDLLLLADYVVATKTFPRLWTGIESTGDAMLHMVSRLPAVKFVITTLGSNGCVMLDTRFSNSEGEASGAHLDEQILSLQQLALAYQSRNGTFPVVEESNVQVFCCENRLNGEKLEVTGKLTVSTAVKLSLEEVVDTTGAGDAFIGAVLYALCNDLPTEKMLRLASTVAASKCKKLGARPGLPRRGEDCLEGLL